MSSKKVDINQLEALHIQAQNFVAKANAAADNITREINNLSNPAMLDGLRGGQGDLAVEAILSGKQAIEELSSSLRTTSRHLDEKISQAILLSKDTNGMADAQAKARQARAAMDVRKK